MGRDIRGQGSLEYLLLLGIVLIIVMIAVTLLGSFSQTGRQLQKTQSESYWSGSATPISVEKSFMVVEIKTNGSAVSKLTLQIENTKDTWLTLNSININPGGFYEVYDYEGELIGNSDDLDLILTPGARNVIVLVDPVGSYSPQDGFNIDLSFDYTTSQGVPGEQSGGSQLVGDSYVTFEEEQLRKGCILLLGMFWWCP